MEKESKFKMRSLKLSDIFAMSKILKKMNIKFEIEEGATSESLGVALVQKVLENIYQAEDEVSSFLGDLVGITADEFKELGIDESIEIIDLFKKQKGIANFLKQAGKLIT